jgi:hypothetical protein
MIRGNSAYLVMGNVVDEHFQVLSNLQLLICHRCIAWLWVSETSYDMISPLTVPGCAGDVLID